MTFSCVYNNKSVSKFSEGKIQFAIFQVISVCKIKQYRTTNCTCHLIHHSGCLVPVYIFCVLTYFCIIIKGHFALIEKVINDRTDQHFKRSRRADTCCRNNIGADISIKSTCFKTILLRTFHHSCYKCCCAFFVITLAEFCKVNYDFIPVSFTCDTDHLCSIRISCPYRIQINASCNYFTTVMICMITNDLCSSRCCKVFCLILSIDF